MKKVYLVCLLLLSVSAASHAQNNVVKVFGGYNMFGEGDVAGYSAKVSYQKNIPGHSSKTANRLYIGPQISFENGLQQPKVLDPTSEQFYYGKAFYHITNTVLAIKTTYYPFHRIIPGLSLSFAPAIGYKTESSEAQASLTVLSNGQTLRTSILSFNKGVFSGYTINAGYDLIITKKVTTGVCIELDNYGGYYNSFWGANVSLAF